MRKIKQCKPNTRKKEILKINKGINKVINRKSLEKKKNQWNQNLVLCVTLAIHICVLSFSYSVSEMGIIISTFKLCRIEDQI